MKPLLLNDNMLIKSLMALILLSMSGCRKEYKEYMVFDSPDKLFRLVVTMDPDSFAVPGDGGHGSGYLELWRNGLKVHSSKHSDVGLVEKVIWTESEVIVVGYEALSLLEE